MSWSGSSSRGHWVDRNESHMKIITLTIAIFCITLTACKSTTAQVDLPTAIIQPTSPIIPTLVLTSTPTQTPISTITSIPSTTATMTKTPFPTSTAYPPKGACPLDLSSENINIFALYKGPDHPGLDIAAPMGTSHISPGDCTVLYFYVEDNGGQGAQLRCANLPSVDRISLHHIDLSYNDFETLRYYGIPVDEVFNDDGTIKKGEFSFGYDLPNAFTSWGNDLHIYSGNSGSSLPHTHINVWILIDGELAYQDPLEFLDCQE
jgi:hypothetical protein